MSKYEWPSKVSELSRTKEYWQPKKIRPWGVLEKESRENTWMGGKMEKTLRSVECRHKYVPRSAATQLAAASSKRKLSHLFEESQGAKKQIVAGLDVTVFSGGHFKGNGLLKTHLVQQARSRILIFFFLMIPLFCINFPSFASVTSCKQQQVSQLVHVARTAVLWYRCNGPE